MMIVHSQGRRFFGSSWGTGFSHCDMGNFEFRFQPRYKLVQATKLLPQSEGLFPVLLSIPAGSFLMGSDIGQDNEQPVHRVWVNNFLLAARQVTNADYIRFLRD